MTARPRRSSRTARLLAYPGLAVVAAITAGAATLLALGDPTESTLAVVVLVVLLSLVSAYQEGFRERE